MRRHRSEGQLGITHNDARGDAAGWADSRHSPLTSRPPKSPAECGREVRRNGEVSSELMQTAGQFSARRCRWPMYFNLRNGGNMKKVVRSRQLSTSMIHTHKGALQIKLIASWTKDQEPALDLPTSLKWEDGTAVYSAIEEVGQPFAQQDELAIYQTPSQQLHQLPQFQFICCLRYWSRCGSAGSSSYCLSGRQAGFAFRWRCGKPCR